MNRHYWERDWPGFAEFFFTEICNEPHSTKLIEDMVGFACESTAAVQLAEADGELHVTTPAEARPCWAGSAAPCSSCTAPTTGVSRTARGARVAELTGGRLVTLEGSGHLPQGREPVLVNLLLRDFVDQVAGNHRPRTWTRALDRRPRVLYLSSPIGLGHARRDLAIVRQLREQRPDVVVDWLTQEPVITFLESQGERVHPASSYLASESRHFESVAGEHDLHAFQAIRAMDEVLVANFMVFNELVTEQHYDLWVGDEAWDVDHFLHENPELKRAPFAWLTDFVGWLPMPDGGPAEAALTADYNAEMVEHVARYPWLRDKALFVGNPDDVVADGLGAGAARHPRVDRGELRVHRIRDGLRRRPIWPTGPSCATGSATARTRRCASSASVARVWASTCCAGWPSRTTTRPAWSRVCAWCSSPARASIPARSPATTVSRLPGTCPTCTSIWPRATSPSCRAV